MISLVMLCPLEGPLLGCQSSMKFLHLQTNISLCVMLLGSQALPQPVHLSYKVLYIDGGFFVNSRMKNPQHILVLKKF